jgi:diaminopimelate decarboxylase
MNPTNMLHYKNGHMHVDSVAVSDILTQTGTPCYIYSRDRALANLARVRAAFPNADVHYSLKANANLALVAALVNAGAGVDAVSGGEIYRALRAGAHADHIVFAGVGKTEAELEYALSVGVGWINVESAQELERLAAFAHRFSSTIKKMPRVALRINPDVRADTHHHIATGHAAAKFGISVAEARDLLRNSALPIEGLHIHIGSQLGTVDRTVEALRTILPLYEEFPQLNTLDLGGGFPVSYTGEPVPPVEDFAAALNPLLSGVHVILEPGRYIVADAGILVVEVQYIKSVQPPAPQGVIAVTDGGMTELIRPALYSAIHGVLPLVEESGGETVRTHVVGPVCESADILRADVQLPRLNPGDKLAILHAGAYGAVMGSTYNARPRPPEVLVESTLFRVVRRRETWDDLVALEEGLVMAEE